MGKYIIYILYISILLGCKSKPEPKSYAELPINALVNYPRPDSVSPPAVYDLDTCIQTQHITVSITKKTAGAEGMNTEALSFSAFVTHYGAEQGLYSSINTIFKDHSGNFWFGTGGGGAIRFDGKIATSYTTAQGLATNAIRTIAEDKQGNIWLGSNGGGASKFDGNYFTRYSKANGLSGNAVRSIVINDDEIWFGTYGGGISVLKGNSLTYINVKTGLPSDKVNFLKKDIDGIIWCSTDSCLCTIEPKTRHIRCFTNSEGLPKNRILTITEGANQVIWLGTEGAGLCAAQKVIGSDSIVFATINEQNDLHGLIINHILEDSKGVLWLSTNKGAIGLQNIGQLLKPKTQAGNAHWQHPIIYDKRSGFELNEVQCGIEDEAGNLWFGSLGGGISRVGFSAIQFNDASREPFTFLNTDRNGTIWMSGEKNSICYITGNNLYTINGIKPGHDVTLNSMWLDKNGMYWFGTNNGFVYRCTADALQKSSVQLECIGADQKLNLKTAWCIAEDAKGRTWIGSDNGLYCLDKNKITNYTTAQGLGSNVVWSSFTDRDGDIWFGTFGGGISKFIENPADGGPARFISYSINQGQASNNIKSITQDTFGNYWLGTGGGGLIRFNGQSFINYTTLHGLTNKVVMTLSFDKIGNLWCGTNEGFTVLKNFEGNSGENNGLIATANNCTNQQIAEQYKPVFEKYYFRNGYPVKDINPKSMFIDSANVIWAGSTNQLIKFDYSALKRNHQKPTVFIKGVEVSGKKICWHTLQNRLRTDSLTKADSLSMINEEYTVLGEAVNAKIRDELYSGLEHIQFDSIKPFYPLPVNLVLPYRNNEIAFTFSSIELTRPEQVKYQFKLDGYDERWSEITERTSASFGNIPEGKYTFQVRALSPGGVWSDSYFFTFEVLPPMYRTWWAYIIYVVLCSWTIYLIVNFRVRVLKQENLRLEKIVAERTEQIAREKAEVETKANDLKKLNQFKDKTFSILSHDLRGPIASSTVLMSMLDDGQVTQEEFMELREHVLVQLTATGTMLDNLLSWAKGSMQGTIEPHPRHVNLYELTNRNDVLFKERTKEKNIKLVNAITNGTTAWCDEEHLDIVLRNLIANAIKFTPDGGTITVSSRQQTDNISITVTDTGVGMTTEQLEKLFKPIIDNTTYGTAGEKGTGLGLLLSNDFVIANNGYIKVKSIQGKGTEFTVVLPSE